MALVGGEAGGGAEAGGVGNLEEGEGLGEDGEAGLGGNDKAFAGEVEEEVDAAGLEEGEPVGAIGGAEGDAAEGEGERLGFLMEEGVFDSGKIPRRLLRFVRF